MNNNKFTLETLAISQNESLLRNIVANFCLPLSPTLEQIADVKTAVSEGVTNCVVHAYKNSEIGKIQLDCTIDGETLQIKIRDFGCGIPNIKDATEAFFTTKQQDERAGLGFTLMTALTDEITVENCNPGVLVTLTKNFAKHIEQPCEIKTNEIEDDSEIENDSEIEEIDENN